ncbi:hypothetical protein HWV62_41300 [Athelia sp. TMB]|nr:hypothetical protein HWV62_41300 [Athelia sp. TMB]
MTSLETSSSPTRNKELHCECNSKGRNLALCIDGTSNQFGQNNTNVIELYSQIVEDESQLTYYNSGIGTYAKPSWRSFAHWKQVLDNKIDLGIAWGAYQVRTLAGMIHKARSIYGLSKILIRQVSSFYRLASYAKGMRSRYRYSIPLEFTRLSAYNVYADPNSSNVPTASRGGSSPSTASGPGTLVSDADSRPSASESMAKRFKKTFSRDVRVHFVGAWDTVSSIGIVRGKSLPGTVSAEHICHFRHALALDERRVKFLPEYCFGGDGPASSTNKKADRMTAKADAILASGSNGLTATAAAVTGQPSSSEESQSSTAMKAGSVPHIKEVWFTGTHSDIGGGNVSNPDMQRSGAPLLWMCYEAISCGLKMSLHSAIWKWEELGVLHESLTGVWKLFEWFPFRRLTYKNESETTSRWHRGRGRIIQPGQKVHISVAFARKDYQPKAKYPKGQKSPSEAKSQAAEKWKSLLQSQTVIKTTGETEYRCPEEWKEELEMDMFDVSVASTAIDNLLTAEVDATAVHRLSVLTWSEDGRKALNATEGAPRKVFDALANKPFKNDLKLQAQMLSALVRFADKIPGLQDHESLNVVSPLLQDDNEEHSRIALNFIGKFSASPMHKLLSQLGFLKSLIDILSNETLFTQQKFNEAVLQPPISPSKQSNFEILIAMAAKFTSDSSKEAQRMLQYSVAAIQHIVATSLPHLRAENDAQFSSKALIDTISLMVASEVKHSQTCALDLLSTLFISDAPCRRRVLEDKSLSRALTNLALRGQWVTQHHLAECLARLASCGDLGLNEVHRLDLGKITTALRERNGALIAWLSQELQDSQISDIIPRELKNVALTQSNRSRPNERKGVEPLPDGFNLEQVPQTLAALDDKEDDKRYSSLEIILKLIPHHEARAELLKYNIISRILCLFDDQNWRNRESAVNAITEFIKLDYPACEPFQTDVIAQTLHILDDEDYDVRYASLMAITAMISFETMSQEILGAGLVEKIILRCKDGSARVRQVSVRLLGMVIQKDYHRHEVFNQVMSCVTNLFQDSAPEVQRAATTAIVVLMTSGDALSADLQDKARTTLRGLALEDNHLMKLSSIGAISALLQFGEDAHLTGIFGLTQTCLDHSQEQAFVSTAITRVLVCLVDESEELNVRQSAIQAVLDMSRSGGIRTMLFDGEVADKLLGLLNDNSWEIRQNAVDAISELLSYGQLGFRYAKLHRAYYVAENARKHFLVVESIQKVMKLLVDSDPDVCNSVNSIIVKMVQLGNAPSSLFEARITDSVLNLFGDIDEDVQESAVQALLAMMNSGKLYDARGNAIADTKLIAASQSDSNKTYLLVNLLTLFKHEDPRFMGRLLKLLKHSDWRVRQQSMIAITALWKNCEFVTSKLDGTIKWSLAVIRASSLDQQAIAQTLDLLQDEDVDVRDASMKAIDSLLSHDDARSQLFEKNVLSLLMAYLIHHNIYVKLSALQIFTKMIRHDIAKTTLLKSSMIAPFLQACRDKDGDVRETLVRSVIAIYNKPVDGRMIKSWSTSDDSRLKLLNTDFMDVLVPLLNDEVQAVREVSINAIITIVSASNARSKLTEADAVSRLLKLTSDKDSDQGLAACSSSAIIAMTKYVQFSKPLLDAHAVDHLSLSLRHSAPSRQLLAFDMIKSLADLDAVQKVMIHDKIPSIIVETFLKSTGHIQIKRAASDSMKLFVKQAKHVQTRPDDSARDLIVSSLLPEFDLSMVAPNIDDDGRYLWGPWYQCIKTASEHGICRQKLIAGGLIFNFLEMLCQQSAYTRIVALDALLEFSQYDDVRASMADYSFVVPLVGMLREQDALVQCSLFATVKILIEDELLRAKIANSSFPNCLAMTLAHAQSRGFPELPQFRTTQLDCAAEFYEYEDLRKEMNACKFNQSLFKLAFIEAPSIRAIAYSPDGRTIASGSLNGSIAVHDANTCDLVAGRIEGHSGAVNAVVYSPDGRFIASASDDTTIRVWHAETCEAVSEPFRGHSGIINSIAYSPDGQFIASSSDDHTILVWNVKTREATSEPLQGHTDEVWAVKYSPDGKAFVSGSCDGTIRFWNAETRQAVYMPFRGRADQACLEQPPLDEENFPSSSVNGTTLAYSPDGHHIASISAVDSKLRVWSVHTGQLLFNPIQLVGRLCPLAYSPDGKRIATCSKEYDMNDGEYHTKIQLWNADTGETAVGPWEGGVATSSVWMGVAYSPDGLRIVSSNNTYIRLWNAETGESVVNPS